LAEIPVILMLVGLAAYVVLGGADFGAGLWELTARGPGGKALRDHTHRAMAPVWEANHVWLIFVLTVCWTAYPPVFSSIASTLSIPLFAAAVGIMLRGASYALRAGTDTPREEGVLSLLFVASSLLTPFALGTMVGGIASDRVPVGNAAGDEITSWLNPTSLLIGALAVATSAYLAGVYLAGDATRMGSREVAESFRRRALIAGVVAGAIALVGPFVLHSDARQLYDGLTSGAGLVAVLVSVVAGAATLALVIGRRFEPARLSAAVAVAAIVAGWGLAQEPTFLPGLTIEEAAASDATITAVLIAIAAGALILVPSLAFLFRLVLTGRFDPAAPLKVEERAAGATPSPRAATAAQATPANEVDLSDGVRPKSRHQAGAAVSATFLALGAVVTFVSDNLLRGAGVTLMLAGAIVLFTQLAALDEDV
jgi:cytochrome d ubiquinol oxidase subunit II